MSLAVVFPGQGSQRVGMGQDWLEHDSVRQLYSTADQALGYSISELCFNGPEEELKLTANQQPAILTTSYAIWEMIRAKLPRVAYFAGHSLGEYTALVAAGAVGFAEAVATVHERGSLMQQAVPSGEGAMAAVMRLDVEEIDKINEAVRAETKQEVVIANLNSPEQTVVSGHAGAVQIAMERYTEAGAARVVELPVSAPFHSPLMVPAADGLKPRLDGLTFSAPSVPVIANLTVEPYPADPAQHPLLLHAQIFNPVRWVETLEYFADHGVTHLLEVGPGKVLRMLSMKTVRQIKAFNIELVEERPKLDEWLAEAASAGVGGTA
ncbi:ACP S-malonyltransferase [bacterium]|nr:ACP S-malonyltransferase [bacterium]